MRSGCKQRTLCSLVLDVFRPSSIAEVVTLDKEGSNRSVAEVVTFDKEVSNRLVSKEQSAVRTHHAE